MNSHQENIKNIESQLKHHESESARLYYKLRKMRRSTELKVSDHALVRYLERVTGIDFEKIKEEVITPELVELYRKLGDGELPNGVANTRCVIQNGVIVTILI